MARLGLPCAYADRAGRGDRTGVRFAAKWKRQCAHRRFAAGAYAGNSIVIRRSWVAAQARALNRCLIIMCKYIFINNIANESKPTQFIYMTVLRRWLLLCVLVAAAFQAVPVLARSETDAEKAGRGVLERQVADRNRGDLDGFLNRYWKSPRIVFQSGGERCDGWEAMRDRYHLRYQAERRTMGLLKFSSLDIESLGPEAVLAQDAGA